MNKRLGPKTGLSHFFNKIVWANLHDKASVRDSEANQKAMVLIKLRKNLFKITASGC
jgi:hypothetical protein